MKNFIFPQVFQPVIGDSAIPLLQQWQNTSRRIRTEVQLTQDNNQYLNKSTQLNLFLKSFTTNLTKRTQKRIDTQKQQEISERQNQHTSSIKNHQNHIEKNTQNQKKDIKHSIRILGPKPTRLIQNKSNSRITLQKKETIDQTKATVKQNEPNQKIHNVKEEDTKDISKLEIVKKKNIKVKKSNRVIFKEKRNRKFDKQPSQNLIQYKNLQQGSKRLIEPEPNKLNENRASKKKLSGTQRRRAQIVIVSPFKENPQKQNKKISVLKKLSLIDHKNKAQNQSLLKLPIFQSTESLVQKNSQDKRKKRKTFNGFEISQKQIKPKRSYTIWDFNKGVHFYESDWESTKKEVTPKKVKKKVHFGRTSIQEKTIQKQIKDIPSQNQEGSIKSGRLRGMILRSKRNDSGTSIDSIQSIEGKKKRLFYNQNLQLKKGAKLKKIEQKDAYNELNYLRMRLNLQKRNSQESQTSKPQTQAIILSVERVMNELQLQRIQKTRVNNMMIDFGVKLTKDSMLKQRALKDRIKNFF